VDEARRQNIPVDGHIPNSISLWEATAAKQRTIEHLFGMELACSSREKDLRPKFLAANPTKKEWDALLLEAWQSYSDERCKALFVELKKNGTWPVPTLAVRHSLGLLNDPQFTSDNRVRYFSGEFRDWVTGKYDPRKKESTASDFGVIRETFTAEQRLTGELFRARVPMLAGTDVGNAFCFPGFSLHDELALLVESGLTPLAALQAATLNAAVFMNATDRYGSIAKGKTADLVLLDADPLQDIHNTMRIREVFLDGKEFSRTALDEILKTAQTEASASDQSQETTMEHASTDSADAELTALMAELRKASIDGDVETAASSMTDDYVQTDINGYRQDKTTWLNEYFTPLADLIKAGKFHWDEYERKNLQFRFYGDCAVVTGDLQAKGTGARFGPQHTWVADPNATFSGTLHFTHVYIKRNGRWMLAALHNQMPLPPAK
jgi:ketosteroid isomerase-like protein